MNPDDWKAYLGFAGATLVFLGAVINVLNGIYSRLGDKDQKFKFWFLLQSYSLSACFVVGFCLNLFTKPLVGVVILAIGVIGWSIQFIRLPEPATRKEILFTIFIVSSLFFGILARFISRIVDLMGKLVKAA